MKTFEVEGGVLEFDDRGEGRPLVLVHGSVFAEPWQPMLASAGLQTNHRTVTYRRRGYGGSSPAEPGRSLHDEAADLIALVDHLGIEQANAVGHSLAADIVLQAAIDAPSRFATLTLLEPGMFTVPAAAGMDKAMAGIGHVFESGDHRQAVLLFLGGPNGAEVMAQLEKLLPGDAGERALADAPALFALDLPAGSGWRLDEDAARSLEQPTLLALGSETSAIYRETNAELAELLPHVERLDVQDAGHFVHLEQPRQIAESLAAFLDRNA
ncbi:MAG: alpha/beta fold hydrolase [Acidimicrobiales bacterium]